jgi:Bacterial Ig-like domain (group 3)/FG-GAP-like repeat
MLNRLRAFLCAVVFLLISVALYGGMAASLSAQGPRGSYHRAKPLVTGSGLNTGTASFEGNFTTIETPMGTLALARQANCSLLLATGTYAINGSGALSYSETGLTPDYEQILHHDAELTTTADVFSKGCALQPSLGFGSADGIIVGTTTSGISVFAYVGPTYPNLVNGIYILSGETSFSLTSFQDSSAGLVTAADLNKDGNGDLVISNSSLASGAYVTVLLGNSDGTFQNGVSYNIGGNYSVAATIDDVTGDGIPDIVAVSGDQQITVLPGKGDGTFGTAVSFAAPLLPGYTSANEPPITNLITADLRGLGRRDLIASNGLVLLNNGSGTFAAAAAPAFPYLVDNLSNGPFIATGDVNNDGKPDLVVSENGAISVWLGNGDGTFTQGQSYTSIASDGHITVADLDGDGNADIYVGLGGGAFYGGNDDDPNLSYALMGRGDGTFAGSATTDSAGYTGTNLADVNGDGVPDLIAPGASYGQTGTSPNFTVQLGTGKGTFATGSTITAPSSFVLGGNTITGANTATPQAYAVGDVNGDGKPDFVYAINNLPFDNNLYLLATPVYFVTLNNGNGTFPTPTPVAFPQIAPAGQFDNSATVSSVQITNFKSGGPAGLIFVYNEIAGGASATYNQGFAVLPGNGNGTFGSPVITSTYSSANSPSTALPPQIVAIADLNKDGNPDLVVLVQSFSVATGATTQLNIFLGNGDGSFKAPIPITLSANVYGIPVVADFNKDGKLDLAFVTEDSSGQAAFAVALGNGDGTFATPVLSNLFGGDAVRSAGLAAADFNGDGNIDLALIDSAAFSGIFYGNGDGTFTSVSSNGNLVPKDLINVAAGFPAVGVDLNGDGKPDVLAGNVALLNIYGSSPTSLSSSTTSLTASATTVTPGTSVTFTGTIAAAAGASGAPTGSVTFMDGATTLGTVTLSSGTAAYSTSALAAGTHNIAALYGGDANFSGSTSSTVTVTVTTAAQISTTTSLSASATTAVTGTSLTFTAQVAAASGSTVPSGTVNFTDGSTAIGSGTLNASGAATFTTSTLAAGMHTIAAQYAGGNGFAASMSSSITVTISVPTPDFSLSISPASGSETGSSSATTTLTVTPSNGFNASVSFACSGLPAGLSCSFNPSTVTPAGAAATTMVTFSGTASALNHPEATNRGGSLLLSMLGLGGILLLRLRRARSLFYTLSLLVLGMATVMGGMTACGGGGSSGGGSQTSTVTITATSGTTSHTTTYSLTASK